MKIPREIDVFPPVRAQSDIPVHKLPDHDSFAFQDMTVGAELVSHIRRRAAIAYNRAGAELVGRRFRGSIASARSLQKFLH